MTALQVHGQHAVWITATRDHTDHLVTDEQHAAGRDGTYTTACGRRIAAASMLTAPGRSCRMCLRQARPARRKRPPTPIERLLAAHQQHQAAVGAVLTPSAAPTAPTSRCRS